MHSAEEIEEIINSLGKTAIENLGSLHWLDHCNSMMKLIAASSFEAANNIEEKTRISIITNEKVSILVYDLILCELWRENICKEFILTKDVGSNFSNIAMAVLGHETNTIGVLQFVLYQRDGVQSLNDLEIDVVDYCCRQLVELFRDRKKRDEEQLHETRTIKSCLNEYERETVFFTGILSLSILFSFTEYMDDLSVAAIDRLYNVHDLPLLAAQLFDVLPWMKNSPNGSLEKFEEAKWRPWTSEKLCKPEAHCWLILRGLLLHQAFTSHYEMTDYRKQRLMMLQKYLHEHVIDQIAPLMELKQFLSQLGVYNPSRKSQRPLLVETIPEVYGTLASSNRKWKKLSKNTMEWSKPSLLVEYLNKQQYLYPEFEEESGNSCDSCGKPAGKKCSGCGQVYYCERECQKKAWKSHKAYCTPRL